MVKSNQYYQLMEIPGSSGGDDVQDFDGNFVPSAPTEPTFQVCRYEPSASVSTFRTSTGNVVQTNGIIFMPRDAVEIEQGTIVKIPGAIEAPVLYFSRGPFNSHIIL